MKILVLILMTGVFPGLCAAPFAPSRNVVDVTKPPYAAKGDGVTDDTESLQQALNENVGRHRLLYFPKGTYLVSSTLTWPKNHGGRENWGMTYLCGESHEASRIRLRDATFTDVNEPRPLMWCGGFGSADWFHNYIENLTFDVGVGNPGATALQFYSNNSGAVRNCAFIAPVGSGHTGLDLAHRDMNGPLLVRNCEVSGFRRGIATAHAVNGQVFEHINLRGQMQVGFVNEGQSISIRGFTSENSVPALSTYGSLCLINANLTGQGDAVNHPAIVSFNGGNIFLRDIVTSGYKRALGDVSHTPDSGAAYRLPDNDKPGSEGPIISEYASQPITSLFPSPPGSLRLPVKETPVAQHDDPGTWANVDDFGADPSGTRDSAEAIQKAVDSGASTLFLPGSYNIRTTVILGGKVRRLTGLGGQINYGTGLHPDFRLSDGHEPVVFIEHFAHIGGGLEVDTKRTLVVRSVSDCNFTATEKAEGGEWFFEDVVTHDLHITKQKLWGRQLNIENEGTHLRNDGGDLWILGYKTERGGTLLDTRGGGRSEILGGFSYTTTAGKLAPMFVNSDSSVWVFFKEICYNNDPFAVIISESRGTRTRILTKDQIHTWPYSAQSPSP